ncbi:MAG: hypothetical protein MUP14_06485 [Dehalococcoidia bacterium]|nr:hypothetical protein [Dehalococcoidia bacterium]
MVRQAHHERNIKTAHPERRTKTAHPEPVEGRAGLARYAKIALKRMLAAV